MHDDYSSDYSSEDVASKLKLLECGKKRTLEVLGEDEDKPESGVLCLPYMVSFCYYSFGKLFLCTFVTVIKNMTLFFILTSMYQAFYYFCSLLKNSYS